VASDAFLPGWCDRYLGARPARVLFRSGHLSQVVGVELADGRRVVIKARPAGRRIAGCIAVQRHLARTGFPCPAPLTDPVQARGLTVTAEILVPGGSQLPAEGGAAPSAALLARLVSTAPSPAAVPSLAPSPPWTGWDHPGSRLWPDHDDAWMAGLWVRLFNAKKDAADGGGPQLDRLAAEIGERLGLAALGNE